MKTTTTILAALIALLKRLFVQDLATILRAFDKAEAKLEDFIERLNAEVDIMDDKIAMLEDRIERHSKEADRAERIRSRLRVLMS